MFQFRTLLRLIFFWKFLHFSLTNHSSRSSGQLLFTISFSNFAKIENNVFSVGKKISQKKNEKVLFLILPSKTLFHVPSKLTKPEWRNFITQSFERYEKKIPNFEGFSRLIWLRDPDFQNLEIKKMFEGNLNFC